MIYISYCSGTIITIHLAFLTTYCVTEPIESIKFFLVDLVITIMSKSWSIDLDTISLPGLPNKKHFLTLYPSNLFLHWSNI